MSDYFSEDLMNNIFSKLTEDLMINILRRLSMKVLLRCGSVCKSWKALIASSSFINAHLNFNRYNAPQFLIRTCKDSLLKENDLKDDDDDFFPEDIFEETYLSYYCNTETFDLHNKFEVPYVARTGLFDIAGSCNGLICLTDRGYPGCGYPSFLWNPFINKGILIPKCIYYDDRSRYRLAFGFDMATNDYKIVRISSHNTELFRLSTRIWEDITHLAPRTGKIYGRSVNLNGAAHWISVSIDWTTPKGFGDHIIEVYDFHSEVFRRIRFSSSLKENLVKASRMDFELASGHESLCLIHENVCDDPSKSDIWLMKEYGVAESWIKQYSVNFDPSFTSFDFLPNGELLWESKNSVISYNLESKKSRVIVSGTSTRYGSYVCDYVPSLVLNDQKVDYSDSNKRILGLNVESIHENLQI